MPRFKGCLASLSRRYQFVMKWLYSPLRFSPVQNPTLEVPPVLDIPVPQAWTKP